METRLIWRLTILIIAMMTADHYDIWGNQAFIYLMVAAMGIGAWWLAERKKDA